MSASRLPTTERSFPARLPGGIRWYPTLLQARQARESAWREARHRNGEKARARRQEKAEEAKAFWKSLHPNQQRAWRRIRRHLDRTSGAFSWRTIRERFYGQHRRCFYCQERFEGGATPSQAIFHIEHKRPICQGGTNDPSNLCLACPRCNLEKSGAGFHDYLRARRRRNLAAPDRSQQFPAFVESFDERPRRSPAVGLSKDPWEAPTTFIRRRPERGKAVPKESRLDVRPPSRKAKAYGEATTKARQ